MANNEMGRKAAASVRLKRVYAEPSAGDGTRILVDRLWPRGIAKEKAKIDLWLKDIAPSDALRRRVHANATAWEEFVVDYGQELAQAPAASAVEDLIERIGREPVTLLYAARDETRNNAVVLKHWLQAKQQPASRRREAAATPRQRRNKKAAKG
jgi:uncharacterized protein YeaO (DUF488 family)